MHFREFTLKTWLKFLAFAMIHGIGFYIAYEGKVQMYEGKIIGFVFLVLGLVINFSAPVVFYFSLEPHEKKWFE